VVYPKVAPEVFKVDVPILHSVFSFVNMCHLVSSHPKKSWIQDELHLGMHDTGTLFFYI
jgi:hypothetical protein